MASRKSVQADESELVARPSGAQRKARSATRERTEHVLSVAAELFEQHGYRGTTVRMIGDAAGVLSGSLYYHFPSKEAIVGRLFNDFFDVLLENYRSAAEADDSSADIFREYMRIAFRVIEDHRAAIIVFQRESEELLEFGDFADVVDAVQEVEDLWVRVLEDATASGEFICDEPRMTYRLVRDAIWGAARWYKPGGGLRPDDLAEKYIAVLIQGLAAR